MVPRWLAVNSQSWVGGGGEWGGGVAGKGSEMVGEQEGGQRERELELENFILSGL